MNKNPARSALLVIVALVAIAYTAACSTEKPATLPSMKSCVDDLTYFPTGPEFKLTKQVQAIEEYKRRQQGEPASDQADSTDAARSEEVQMELDEK